MKRMLIGCGFVALVFAGVASAYGVKTIMLSAGHCTTVKKTTRVCARQASLRVRYRTVTETDQELVTTTVTAPAVTVTAPAVTVTAPAATVTQPIIITTPTPTPTVPITTCSTVVENFTGNGSLTESPFSTCNGETLSWTWDGSNLSYGGNFFLNDDAAFNVLVDSQGLSGSTYLPSGQHTLDVIAEGNWTFHVGP